MSLQKPGTTKGQSRTRAVKKVTLSKRALKDLAVRNARVKGGAIYGDPDPDPSLPRPRGPNGNGYYN